MIDGKDVCRLFLAVDNMMLNASTAATSEELSLYANVAKLGCELGEWLRENGYDGEKVEAALSEETVSADKMIYETADHAIGKIMESWDA